MGCINAGDVPRIFETVYIDRRHTVFKNYYLIFQI